MWSRAFSRIFRSSTGRRLISSYARPEPFICPSNGSNSLIESKWVPCQTTQFLRHSAFTHATSQRVRFSFSTSPQSTEKETNQFANHDSVSQNVSEEGANTAGLNSESNHSKFRSVKRRRRHTKRTAFSSSDAEPDLSIDDLVRLVAEKEELLKLKHKEIEKMQDKVLRCYAEMENVLERTKREAENSKKFAVQNFAKSLLDVADNLRRASSVVKESFSKIDKSKDTIGAVPLLETLLEGVEMTEKQLDEVFRKFGVEKFDPINEPFDPNRHHAVFQIPDASKPPETVAVVLKPGYIIYDRVLRPAEVGVTVAVSNGTDQSG